MNVVIRHDDVDKASKNARVLVEPSTEFMESINNDIAEISSDGVNLTRLIDAVGDYADSLHNIDAASLLYYANLVPKHMNILSFRAAAECIMVEVSPT